MIHFAYAVLNEAGELHMVGCSDFPPATAPHFPGMQVFSLGALRFRAGMAPSSGVLFAHVTIDANGVPTLAASASAVTQWHSPRTPSTVEHIASAIKEKGAAALHPLAAGYLAMRLGAAPHRKSDFGAEITGSPRAREIVAAHMGRQITKQITPQHGFAAHAHRTKGLDKNG